jgi:hypothetical protein
MKSLWRTDETPDCVSAGVDEEVPTDRSHTAKLLGKLPVDRSEALLTKAFIDARKDARTEESTMCRKRGRMCRFDHGVLIVDQRPFRTG